MNSSTYPSKPVEWQTDGRQWTNMIYLGTFLLSFSVTLNSPSVPVPTHSRHDNDINRDPFCLLHVLFSINTPISTSHSKDFDICMNKLAQINVCSTGVDAEVAVMIKAYEMPWTLLRWVQQCFSNTLQWQFASALGFSFATHNRYFNQ